MPLNRVEFMNTFIDNVTAEEGINYIDNAIKNKEIIQVIFPNVDQIVKIEKDDKFSKVTRESDLILVDGHPLMWIASRYGKPFKEKIPGSSFVFRLCELSVENNYSIFLLGAADGVADIAADKLKNIYKNISISGTYSPPLGFENDEEEIKKINNLLKRSNSDILLVGMGVPKQEYFIAENKEQYQIPVSLSVGATIDFIAGVQKKAPQWMSNIGMEWFYRLISDPKRMFKRYIIDDTKIFSLYRKYKVKR
uniref:WecB/TagA/CpsF family glycosyltransferase n=1 Tax=Erysipelothrix tonsillarum TaxID=38402 RepID=A0A6S6I6Q5_9FIRM|nr:WecB/TagA/CpsF family glycosyltransferase [Erysipelothrix tonsillarum]